MKRQRGRSRGLPAAGHKWLYTPAWPLAAAPPGHPSLFTSAGENLAGAVALAPGGGGGVLRRKGGKPCEEGLYVFLVL
jgi:hypothetical protein